MKPKTNVPQQALDDLHLTHVHRGRVSDQVVLQLKELIDQEILKPGQKIPGEYQLAQRFSASRASVREALRSLETMGLVVIKSGSGAYVDTSPFNPKRFSENLRWLVERHDTVLQILQVREVLQGLGARLCAESVTNGQLQALLETLETMTEARDQQDAERATEADTRFHFLIGEFCGNAILNELIKRVEETYRSSNRALMDLRGRAMASVNEHSIVIDAIQAHKGALAEKQMRRHIANVRADVVALGHD